MERTWWLLLQRTSSLYSDLRALNIHRCSMCIVMETNELTNIDNKQVDTSTIHTMTSINSLLNVDSRVHGGWTRRSHGLHTQGTIQYCILTAWGFSNKCCSALIPGAARVGPKARPAATIVKSPMCARTGLPPVICMFCMWLPLLTSVVYRRGGSSFSAWRKYSRKLRKSVKFFFLRRPLKLKFAYAFVVGIWRHLLVSILKISQDWQS